MSPATSKGIRIVVVRDLAVESSQRIQARSGVDVVMVETLQQVKHEAQRGPIDGLVVSDKASLSELKDLSAVIDVSRTLILAGPFSVAEACDGMHWLLNRHKGRKADRGRTFQDLTFEDYIESKFGEFVRAMKASSARSLHVTLIRAVEEPLIQHALRETDGNQVQAARLLGMNRNTLRKKIAAHRIPLKRQSSARPLRKT